MTTKKAVMTFSAEQVALNSFFGADDGCHSSDCLQSKAMDPFSFPLIILGKKLSPPALQ